MTRFLSLFIALLLSMEIFPAAAAQSTSPPVHFEFDSLSVAQVINLIYFEAIRTPFVIDPDVLTDTRKVAFRYGSENGNIKEFLSSFLGSLGYVVDMRGGVDFIHKSKIPDASAPDEKVLVYLPKYRDVAYLARLLSPIFTGSFSVNRSVRSAPGAASSKQALPEGSAASLLDQTADALVFSGTEKEVTKLNQVLPQVDTAVGEVVVRGVVYEVADTEKAGSAFGMLASLLGGKLSIGVGATSVVGDYIKVQQGAFEAVYAMLANDSHFKVLSSPTLRIRSGSRGTFSVGQDVPVLGALSFPQGAGQAVQSVEYRSSGVLFEVRPTVRESVIELDIDQQLSNFVNTTTGVNGSPTLTKRALQTSVGLQDGDVILLGGLSESKTSRSRDGLTFLPRFLDTKGKDDSRSEIVLMLQVSKVARAL